MAISAPASPRIPHRARSFLPISASQSVLHAPGALQPGTPSRAVPAKSTRIRSALRQEVGNLNGPLQQSWGVWGEYPPHNQHSRTDSPITAEGASRAGPRGGTAPTTTVSPPRAAVGGVGGGPPTQSTQPDRQPGDRKGRQPARAQN